jgi:hypothetical protein
MLPDWFAIHVINVRERARVPKIDNLSLARRMSPKETVGRSVHVKRVLGGPVLDMVGQMTHVSSTIGEDANNALAEAFITYNVKIMPVKVCVDFSREKTMPKTPRRFRRRSCASQSPFERVQIRDT